MSLAFLAHPRLTERREAGRGLPGVTARAGTRNERPELASTRACSGDDNEERNGRLPLLGKGAVVAHRLARRPAAEADDDEQSGRSTRRYRDQ